MMRRVLSTVLLLCLVFPGAVLAQEANQAPQTKTSDPGAYQAASAPASAANSPRQSDSVRPNSRAQRRSYERETRTRRHSGISKNEKIFMVAVAGTSMGIGALAGGGTGLAIGAIVGGWGAYASHRLWHWIR
jgi:hypothetical protein